MANPNNKSAHQAPTGEKHPLLAHLTALRNVLIISAAAVGIAFVLVFYLAGDVLMNLMLDPIRARGIEVIYTAVSEALLTKMKVALIAAILHLIHSINGILEKVRQMHFLNRKCSICLQSRSLVQVCMPYTMLEIFQHMRYWRMLTAMVSLLAQSMLGKLSQMEHEKADKEMMSILVLHCIKG